MTDLLTENARLRAVLEWYGEQARLCRLIHREGDAGRNALADDGGKRARNALATPAPDAPVAMRPETEAEHLARDMREGRFPDQSERQMVPVMPAPDAVQEAARVPEIAALIEAAKALHRDMLERAQLKIDTISGEQYRIVNSGRTAWADFNAALRAIAGDRT